MYHLRLLIGFELKTWLKKTLFPSGLKCCVTVATWNEGLLQPDNLSSAQVQSRTEVDACSFSEFDNENVCSFQRDHKCHSACTHRAEKECSCLDAKSFEYAKSFKYASWPAPTHWWMQQFRTLISRSEASREGVLMLLTALHPCSPLDTVSHAFLSRLGTQPESSGTVPKSISLPHSLPGQQTEVTWKDLTLVYLSREPIFWRAFWASSHQAFKCP